MARAAENDLTGTQAAWAIVAPDAKEGMFAHAERLHAQNTPFIFDLGQAMPLFSGEDIDRMLGLARILTANDYEAGIIEQRTGRGLAEIASTLDAVVVRRGARGATLYADGGETAIEPEIGRGSGRGRGGQD